MTRPLPPFPARPAHRPLPAAPPQRPPASRPGSARTAYRHGRPVDPRRGRRRARPLPLLALVLVGLVGAFLLVDRPDATPVSLATPSGVSWPAEGQAAYATSAIGELRASGSPQAVPIASVTKVMTAYVVLHDDPLELGEDGPTIELTDAVVADTERRRAGGESVVEVAAGERLTELQALQALLLPSANNIAAVLATFSAGSEEEFVERMNDTAEELGMPDTHYDDSSGMSAASVSTAVDQVRLFDAAMADPVFAAISGQATAELPVAGTVRSTNALLGQHGFVAGKTGSHDAAGGCLVFRVEQQVGGRTVTVTGAVLGQHDGPLIKAALTAADELAAEILASADAVPA